MKKKLINFWIGYEKKSLKKFKTISILKKLRCFCINVKQNVSSLKCAICFSKVAKVTSPPKVHATSFINYKKFLAYLCSLPFFYLG
jgi:hypothetical protein